MFLFFRTAQVLYKWVACLLNKSLYVYVNNNIPQNKNTIYSCFGQDAAFIIKRTTKVTKSEKDIDF